MLSAYVYKSINQSTAFASYGNFLCSAVFVPLRPHRSNVRDPVEAFIPIIFWITQLKINCVQRDRATCRVGCKGARKISVEESGIG